MHKRLFIGLLLFSHATTIFADTQQAGNVHQYIICQAWELAKFQCPDLINTDMADHIGTSEKGDDNAPWSNGLVVTGAYREDCEDPVYLYGGINPSGINLAHVTMSHFWNADGGDDFKWNWEGADWKNAYQKAKKYVYGEYPIFFYVYNYPICGRFYSYNNLFEYYNTGNCYYEGYADICYPPNITMLEEPILISMVLTQARNRAYLILGRVCHLIADMGTPAHVHNDAHIPADSYETYMETDYSDYDWQDALESGGLFFNIFNYVEPLRFLLYTTNQIADHFPSEDILNLHLETGDNNVTYTFGNDYYEELFNIIENLGSVPNSVNESDIAENAFIYSIRTTATMIYWFAKMTNQLPTKCGSLVCNEIWNFPHNLTGDVTIPSGITLNILSDAVINLNGHSIVSTGGTIAIQSGATINSSNSHVRLVTGSTINRLCPTIASAVAAGSSGQTFEIYGPHTLTTNYSIPSVISLSIKSGTILTLGSYSIVSSGGTITVASGATLSPDARRVSGSTLLGLYPSISSALSAASGSQIVEYRGSHSMSGNLTVASGITLSAKAGSTLSFGSGYYLSVSGTLNASGTSASRATFTRSGASGTWGGIRYQSGSSGTLSYANIYYGSYGVYLNSSNPDVDHCNISSCSNGIYCTGCSPDITNNSISGGSYGIYVYNGSPDLETNYVNGSQVYLNACDSYIHDNYFTDASNCNQALYLYNSSPTLVSNTIMPSSAILAIYANHYSDALFGEEIMDGYNYISNTNDGADGVIWAVNYSNPIIGYGTDVGPYFGGNNSIIGSTGAGAFNSSSIYAQYCWWGQYPATTCYGNVYTTYALSSDPGGGSSLAKKSFIPDKESELTSDLLAADSLYKVGMNLFFKKQYEEAVSIFKSIIVDYPGTVYASKALSRAMWVGRKYEKLDRLVLLDELLDQTDNKNLTAALKGRQVLLYRQAGEIEKAVKLSQEILSENPDSVRECTALFDLFNLYQKDLGDSVTAGEYLSVLKAKYPDDDHTLVARNDCGEDVTGIISKRQTIPTAEPEVAPVAVLPSEFSLNPAQPNPFNMSTNLTFNLPEEARVEIVVYDLMGREIWKSAKTNYSAGTYSVVWNGTNHSGQPVGTGMYLIRLNSAKYNATQKVLLMK